MPITEDAKDLLRERLKVARQAKLDKKNKVTEALNKPVAPPPAPAIVAAKPPAAEHAPEVAPLTPAVETKPTVAINQPIDSVAILPKASKGSVANKPPLERGLAGLPSPKAPVVKAKNKYAKLVFYQEPTSKKMKKLTKLMDNSSDSEDDDFHYKPPPVQQTSSQQLHYNKISQLSRMIFD
tara:strand:+ start:11259 stop:11801 length:543 start_codon:yes stop_codon:yes gene_type:complete